MQFFVYFSTVFGWVMCVQKKNKNEIKFNPFVQ